MRKYIWIPLLMSLEIILAKAESNIYLPTDSDSVSVMTSTCPAPDPSLNYRPVIGIVSHPGDGASGRLSNATNASYIAASYVKFVESAGARVIPLIYNEPLDILQTKLNLVNGVLFTGGWSKSGLYFDVIEGIFKQVLKKNDAGEHFPLLAICLGFELLTMIISKNNNILEDFSASDQASTLQFMKKINIEETLFQRFPPELIAKLSTECLVMQNHKYGISPETFQGNTELCSFFKILTTSTDQNNKVYVSTVQSENYPVTAVQWHPEKNAFEWGSSVIPHSDNAIQVTQHVANFFIGKTFNPREETSFWLAASSSIAAFLHLPMCSVERFNLPTGIRQPDMLFPYPWGGELEQKAAPLPSATLGSEARKSFDRPPAKQVLANLIYNYSPTYCGTAGKGYDEVYIFSETGKIARL